MKPTTWFKLAATLALLSLYGLAALVADIVYLVRTYI